MGYKSKSKRKRTKSRNKYSRRRRNRVTKRVSNRGRNRVTRKYKGWGGMKSQRTGEITDSSRTTSASSLPAARIADAKRIPKEITDLALPRGNLMYEHNKRQFNPDHYKGLSEYDINMVGPDFDPIIIPKEVDYVFTWRNTPANRGVTPLWSEYIGKLCEVPRGFFANNERRPARNLYDVKNNPANFNQNFPRDPTNDNIVEIPTYILGRAQNGVAMNSENEPIPQGKYKFVLMKNNEIRYIPDTDTQNPYYYFPSIMLYFYNKEVITLEELKQSLGNELPHSLLFDAKLKKIMSGGDFTINEYGYLVKASGYSGHIKPNPSNVYLAMQRFINMGYPLDLTKNNSYESRQTGNTERANNSERLFGTYLRIEFDRPQVPALGEAAALVHGDAAVSAEEDEEDGDAAESDI